MRVSGAPPLLLWVGAVWLGVTLVLALGHGGSPRTGVREGVFGFPQVSYSGSIYENSGAKEYIQTTQKMGIELTHPGVLDVEYTITDGDPNSIFKAEAVTVKDFSFLRIRTQTVNYWMLNRERNSHFHLRVQARVTYPGDITLVNYTSVNITVLDQNEFSPLFPTEPYEVSIPEDTSLYRSIGLVRASDADDGINGEVYYSFAQETRTFAIHPTTGVISLTRPVRYKQQQKYELEILAKDRGESTTSRSISPNSKTTFKVNILPVNFNPPAINIHNHQTLIEHGNIGSLFAVLTITDGDQGIHGEISSVAITNDPKRIFSLVAESTSGKYNIMVVSTIDRETMPADYNITITAVDKGVPALTATAVVPVRVQDINDNPPEFEQSVYSVEISEIVPLNTPVVFVKAHDRDLGANADVLYSIADGNKNNLFSIDSKSGLIRTSGQLDADMDMRVSLIVQAQDQANSGSRKTGQTRVVILLKDYNDNAPVFNMALNYVNVKENLPRDSRVTTILANDEDSGDNGKMSYSIVNYDTVPFEVDPFSGEITTKEVLDFETMKRNYDIHVRVSDWGTPFRREEDMVLTVRLEDVNDNSPEFERIKCLGYLSRESPLKMDVVTLTAIDFDSGNIITYSITEGNNDDCFSIVSSTGTITVNCDLSSYPEDTRTLTIVASDGQHVSIPTTVNLTLVNNNRNPALASDHVRVSCQKTDVASRLQQQMQKSKYARMNEQIIVLDKLSKLKNNAPTLSRMFPAHVEISESADIGSVVVDFGAHVTDLDSGYNGQLIFVISGGNDPHGAFKLDSFTGKLQVLSPLDFEEKSEYTITLTAMDLGQPAMQVSVDVRVVVLDENDNMPIFEKPQYSRAVSENALVNSVVLQVKATDLDSGRNSEITYSILAGGNDFSIDPAEGFIKIKRALDRENRSLYRLTVQAEDSGLKAKLASTTTVIITITDINDNIPIFVQEKYIVRVREDLPVGAIITTLAARDIDEGDNGQVAYSLSHGTDEHFDIDSMSGSIRIKRLLDYETKQVYNLTAIVTDHGDPPLSSSCLVTVEVMDVNENRFAPVFPDFMANGSVAENLPIGSYVMHVQSDDQDDPRSGVGQVFYTIQEGSGLGRFSIDVNGTIRTSQVLDRETAPHYWLTVIAQDRALVPQFARLEVLIEVIDVNEKIPLSLEPAYYASVEENNNVIKNVVQIQATDGDDDGSQPLLFSITSGNPQNFFTIDPTTGMISTTNKVLDRERQEEHALEVTISDRGSPPLSSTTRVVIKVTDENDNKPQFLQDRRQQITVFATPHTGQDIFIYRAAAYDPDEGRNGTVTYDLKIARDLHFRVDPKSGKIFSTQELSQGEYDLLIRATDNGASPRRSQMHLDIDVVPRSSRVVNKLTFTQSLYEESITESDKPGQLIVLLSAEDEYNEKLRYSIEGGNEEDKFTIQPDHGSIFLAETVDCETRSSYNLTVAVTDGVRSAVATVLVNVMDVNDNEPAFTHKLYQANISESAELGSPVVTVAASDLDRHKVLLYTIESSASTRSLAMFSIGAQSGVIVVSGSLDREVLSRHLLTVMARDQGIPSKRSYARVEINILDHNDHTPRFLYDEMKSQVYETAALGTSVVQVMAVDGDKGQNAQLTYAIVSGNADMTFTIDEHLGIISVAKELDRNLHSDFEMVISATDHGEYPLTGTTKVKVTITMSTNSPPHFSEKEYIVQVTENMPPDTIITSLTTECLSTVIYAITGGDNEGYFNINPNSGVISTMKPIDFEKVQIFNLTVSASNIVSVSQSVNVIVHVLDINDNAPIFAHTLYKGNVSEDTQPGSVVLDNARIPLVVRATDADSNNNARLQYQIMDREALQYFSIDPNTGTIRTASTLDFEVQKLFNFSVQVSDLGNPQLQAHTSANVVVHVADVNDNPPKFTQQTYQAEVILPTYSDVSVVQIRAVDPDTVFDKPLSYSIQSGNEGGAFYVDVIEGTVFVQKEALEKERFELSVQATDGKFKATTQVIITVQQPGMTTLKFTKDRYMTTVAENTSAKVQLMVIQPVGLDSGSHVTFTLLNNQDLFFVGQTSGVVSTNGLPLDRERKDNYTLVVRVTETGSRALSANVVVLVSVLDVNDNPPMFVNLPYHSTVSGDAREGEVIQVVRAIDPDIGENADLKYMLAETHGNKFALNPYTREVVVKRLDKKDHNTEVVLRIVAQDKGSPSLTAEAAIHIHITDSSSPLFEQSTYDSSIPENAAAHSPVIAVKAISPHGQKLIYSISRGDKYGEFALDFNTDMESHGPCYLSVADLLDYETMKVYVLTVRASDIFTGSYAEATINVTVEDVNDNPPVFSRPVYTQTLSESSSVGMPILKVSTTDADSDANALVHYELSPLTPDSQDLENFLINTQTGEITLRKELDHEKQKEFQFLVVARDGGIPVLSSAVQVIVKVLDVNDNPPTFSMPSYSCFISDSATQGQLVNKVTAFDPDETDAGNLFYSIVEGNEKLTFSMDPASGVISLSRQQKPSLSAAYTLIVSVSDGVYASFARVSVDVRSTNHHTPVFGKDVYFVAVSELQAVGATVVTAAAVDEDRGNYGMVAYYIVNDEMARMFSIDADTGEISLKQPLDREAHSTHNFTIVATDNGGRMGFAKVAVKVKDENDNIPRFLMEEYRANVASNASIGTSVIRIKAEDKDEGNNARIRYMLQPGKDPMVNRLFDVDAVSGLVTTKTSLINAENQVYQFFVQAQDQGSPALENHVPVEILVMGSTDSPPKFADSNRLFFVNEDEQVGTIIATVKARSVTPVKYSIIPGFTNSTNRPMVFSIDEIGQLRLVRRLDREVTPAYTLFVRAETKTSPALMDYLEISIQVRDVNDNTPVFTCSPYLATLPESTKAQYSIIQLQASDQDTEVKPLTFSFGPGMAEMASKFAINPESGWIVLLTQLDREQQEVYNLSVIVSDTPNSAARKSGSGVPLTATTYVVITVTDTNDSPPRFDHDSFSAAVNEGAPPTTVLIRLITKDPDVGLNSQVTYYITDGDKLGQFVVHGPGELRVNKALDRESISRYSLTVAATDGAFVSYTAVNIAIIDDNDNAPVCKQPFYKVELNEDVVKGSQVVLIQATDADESETKTAKVVFSLEGEGVDHFVIDKESGLIRTAKLLDRETKAQFSLTATARDEGGLSCTSSVVVSLKDVNDNPPRFAPGSLRDSYSIREDAQIHTLLTRVVAHDADTGINSHVNYRLSQNSSSVFSLDPESGIISIIASLDREKSPSYSVTIIAYNPITPELSTEATITVLVLDVNDNPPEFQHSSYKATLQESAQVGAVVKQVKATSLDIGVNADIAYSLIAGNEQGKFVIDSQTGKLTVAEPLDHELAREYFITVLATDSGTPPLTNTAVISINVTDINDNPPRFSQDSYTIHVSEGVEGGTEIFKVMATDSDSPPNAKITYSILDGNVNNQFVIDPHEGILQVNSPLDRETVSSYSLVIQAHDSGLPMLLSSAVVSITVDDTNDNPPIFSLDVYKGLVQEGRRTGIEIVTVSVSDADLPENGGPFTYEIVNGNDNGEFHIDGGGVISTAGKLSKKVQERYVLTTRAYDSGKPPLYSEALVEIEVVDESMYAPEIQDLSVTIRSCVGNFPGGVFGRMQASDRDPYDKTIFSIVTPNSHFFDIHRYDGRLIALTGLDPGNYVINVSVSDGKFTSYGRGDIAVICTSKEMLDNSLTIQFENMAEEQFYANFKSDFQKVLKQELDVRTNDIEIINVQPSAESTTETSQKESRKSNRVRRSTSNNLDVLFAVLKSPDRFYNKKSLLWKMERIQGRIESVLGAKVVDIFTDTCDENSCDVGTCVGKVHFDETTLVPVIVNGASFVSARHRYTEQCICLEGNCAEHVCGSTKCTANEVCQKNVFGDYICQCPEGRTGELCENIVPLCSGSSCPIEHPVTFSGKSYAKWKLHHSTKKRFSLRFRLRTRQTSATLMYAKGKVDYSILKIEKGSLVYKFDCGSGEGQVRIPVDLSDGQWHQIQLERHGREAELSLDSAYTAIGLVPGIHAILNVDSEEIFFGAEIDVFPNGYRDISHGFEGCMEDIRVFNIPLPFTGNNELAQALEFEAVEFHCQDFPVRHIPSGNACSSNPCLNGGHCQLSGVNSYSCLCPGSYKGSNCELDPDPCRSQPCNNGSQCEVDLEVPNSVVCQCRNHLTGIRCTYGKFCRPNPCKQGGTCVEGPTAPLCDCAAGYQGLYCERVSDRCLSTPCLHGSTCHNMGGGSYFCNCSAEYTGRNCEVLALMPDSVTSSASRMFHGIIAAGVILVIVVVVVIVFLVWRRRKRERQRHSLAVGLPDSGSEGLLSSSKDKRCKLSNPDLSVPVEIIPCQPPSQPPPVPTRPASYTPSTHDSLNMLNNLDSIGNYGSAAEELENAGLRGHIPDFYQYLESYQNLYHTNNTHPLLRATPPPPGSRTASESDSIQKAPWEFDYPNILENYMEGDKKQNDKMAKQMPGMHSPHSSPAFSHTVLKSPVQFADVHSISSLNESEDDLNAKQGEKKAYHWDTSDWAPGPSIPNISELPNSELLHSPSSSQPSDDCNANADNFHDDDNITTRAIYNGDESPLLSSDKQRHNNIDGRRVHNEYDDGDHIISHLITSDQDQDYYEDSEYVGDSEYAESEPYVRDYFPPEYMDDPKYEHVVHDLDDNYELPGNLSIHPNQYLPKYNFSHQDLDSDPLTEDENMAGRLQPMIFSPSHFSPEQQDYPPLRPPKEFMTPGRQVDSYGTDQGPSSRCSFIDDISMSLGGIASNTSYSDISGLCEIVDSEMSANDTDDENTPCLTQLQTQV